MSFQLHQQLAKDTLCLGYFPLCQVLLHKEEAVPWIILVPQRDQARELYQLSLTDQQAFLAESAQINQVLTELYHPDKLNLAALGNQVPQLHIHHIARFKHDIAWPAPIWGNTSNQIATAEKLQQRAQEITQALQQKSTLFSLTPH